MKSSNVIKTYLFVKNCNIHFLLLKKMYYVLAKNTKVIMRQGHCKNNLLIRTDRD